MFAPAAASQEQLLAFCIASQELKRVAEQSAEGKKDLRKARNYLRKQLTEALKMAGDDVCIPVSHEGNTVYVKLATRKGTRKRITAQSAVEAIRGLSSASFPVGGIATYESAIRAVLSALETPDRQTLIVVKSAPPGVRMVPDGALPETGRRYEEHDARLKKILKEERVAAAPIKERCNSTKENVIAHLRQHDPTNLSQRIRLAQGDSQQKFVLRAKPKKTRTPMKAATSALERVLQAEDRLNTSGGPLLTHLQDEATLTRIYAALKRLLQPVRTDDHESHAMDVVLTPE